MALKWKQYNGDRIPRPGARAFIELEPTQRFAQAARAYAYVWETSDGVYRGYVEDVSEDGQVKDVAIQHTFATARQARRAAEETLEGMYK